MTTARSPFAPRRFQADPALVARVGEWLEGREQWASQLSAISESLPSGGHKRSLLKLTDQLRSDATAEAFCRSRSQVLTLLPLMADGADGGAIEQQLNRSISESLRNAAHRRRSRRLLAYPLAVFLLAVLVLAFLSLTVAPVFQEMFDDFAFDLPAQTLAVLGVARALREWPIVTITSAVGVLFVAGLAWRKLLENAPLLPGRLPAILTRGNSHSIVGMASFVRRLAEGFAARLPELVALRTAGETSDSAYLRRAADRLAGEIMDPNVSLSASQSARRLPAVLIHLLEQPNANSQQTAQRLHDYADMLSERVESRFDWSTGIVAQASVAAVGGMVAFTLFALLTPLVKLVNGLT